MLKLAKLLHHRGFHITFVSTEYIHKRLLRSRGPHSLDGLPRFRLDTIPDGLPPSDAGSTQDIPSPLCSPISTRAIAIQESSHQAPRTVRRWCRASGHVYRVRRCDDAHCGCRRGVEDS
ncbi:hypothetical protein NL676_015963 [Syzygium grande]|nr:hypothetical protein NL676_015963 [Syzygium grande]